MSGTLGILAGGGITVGGVRLHDFEVPDRVPWGTRQLIKEHVYPGGENILQTMGPTRRPIEWSGQMIRVDATSRAQVLDQMAAAGQPVAVAWGSLNFEAVIEDFSADYKHEWQGHYSIRLRVIWDYNQPPAPPDAVTQALADVQQAVTYLPAVVALASAVTMVTSVKQGASSNGTLQATQASLYAAQTAIGTSAAASGAALANAQPAPSTILALTADAANSAACAAAFGYVSRAANNWAQVPGISTPNAAPRQALSDLTQYPGA